MKRRPNASRPPFPDNQSRPVQEGRGPRRGGERGLSGAKRVDRNRDEPDRRASSPDHRRGTRDETSAGERLPRRWSRGAAGGGRERANQGGHDEPVADAKAKQRFRDRDQDPRSKPIRPARSDKPVLWKPGPDARVVRAEAGKRLASFVAHMHPELSVRAARRLIDEGCCRVNGRIETFGSRALEVSDVVEVFLPPQSREHHFDPKRIIYEEDGFLAYDKPAWLPVTPIEGPKSWSLKDILELKLPGPIIPVHRLDADTSGIVLFAKNEKTARILEELFREHEIHKTYHAIVRGHPRQSGERKSYLVKVDSGKGYERWKSGRGPDAREAITTWEVEMRLGHYASLVKIMPLSGRYHQIRIHFSEMGHPIYGDRIYGDRQDPIHVHRHLLHASNLMMPELADRKKRLEIRTRLPREFLEAQKLLEKI
jgi:RluA family pseudouridine synthase